MEQKLAELDAYAQVMAPPPDRPAAAALPVVVLQPAPSPAGAPSDGPKPFYRRWYLWAAVAGVVVAALAVGLGVGLGTASAGALPSATLTAVDAR